MAGVFEFRPSLLNPNLFWGTVIGSLLFTFIPPLVKRILQFFCYESEAEFYLKRQILDLKNELKGINMVDEFPKYAKLERRIRKLSDEATSLVKRRIMKQEKMKVVVNAILHVIGVLVGLTMLWMYKQEPVLIMNEDWLYPLNSLISYPTELPGALGFTAWVIICGRVARIAAQVTK